MVRYLGKLSQTPTHHAHQTPGLSATARAPSRTPESGTTWTTGVAGPRLPRNTVNVPTCTTETLRPLRQRSGSGLAACGLLHRCTGARPLVSWFPRLASPGGAVVVGTCHRLSWGTWVHTFIHPGTESISGQPLPST